LQKLDLFVIIVKEGIFCGFISGYVIGVLYILVLVVWIKENSIAFLNY